MSIFLAHFTRHLHQRCFMTVERLANLIIITLFVVYFIAVYCGFMWKIMTIERHIEYQFLKSLKSDKFHISLAYISSINKNIIISSTSNFTLPALFGSSLACMRFFALLCCHTFSIPRIQFHSWHALVLVARSNTLPEHYTIVSYDFQLTTIGRKRVKKERSILEVKFFFENLIFFIDKSKLLQKWEIKK